MSFKVTTWFSDKAKAQIKNLGGFKWLELVNSVEGYEKVTLESWSPCWHRDAVVSFSLEEAREMSEDCIGFSYSHNLTLFIEDALGLMEKHKDAGWVIEIYKPECQPTGEGYLKTELINVFDFPELIRWAFKASTTEDSKDKLFIYGEGKGCDDRLIAYFHR
jgi:hypothetical protein